MSKKKLSIEKGLKLPLKRTQFEKSKIAYATHAYHKLGDISRADFGVNSGENLCVISSEDDENYFGSWVTGFGFFDVRFPKGTTRGLTNEEMSVISDMKFRINNQPSWGVSGMETL